MIVYDKNGKEIKLQEIKDTGWIDITIILRYRVVNEIVYVQVFDAGATQLKAGDNYLGALPSALAPSKEVILPIQFMGGTDKTINPLVHSRIDASGKVYVYLLSDTKYMEGFVSYPV